MLAVRPAADDLDMTQRNTGFGRRRKAINVLAAVLALVAACGGVGRPGAGPVPGGRYQQNFGLTA